jgi:hypothetical protein
MTSIPINNGPENDEKKNLQQIKVNINCDFTIVKPRVILITFLYLLFLSIGIAIPISFPEYNFNNNNNNTNVNATNEPTTCDQHIQNLYALFLVNRIFCILTIVVFFAQYLSKQFFSAWEKIILSTKILGSIFGLLYFVFILIHIYICAENCAPKDSRKSIYLISLFDVVIITNMFCIIIRRFMYPKNM